MSKQDNLNDFLKDIADTIRTNDGTTNSINPQDFSSKISNTVGSNIPKKSSNNLTYSNYTFNVPSGYYDTNATYTASDVYTSSLISADYPDTCFSKTVTKRLTLPSNRIYKGVDVQIATPSIANTITTYYRGDLVATLTNDDTDTTVSLSPNTLYLFDWEVVDPNAVDCCATIFVAFNNSSYKFNCNKLLRGTEGTYQSSIDTRIWFFVYFDSTSGYFRVRYVYDSGDIFDLNPFELIDNKKYSYSNVTLTGGSDSNSSDTTLYIYKCNLI